jgi:hypothetical protein
MRTIKKHDLLSLWEKNMKKLKEFIKKLPSIENCEKYGVYPNSINDIHSTWVFMIDEGNEDFLIVFGKELNSFQGDLIIEDEISYLKAPLSSENANVLRSLFPFTKPIPVLNKERSFGLGDRLGIATPGHIRVFKEFDAYPIFAQQSIRELTLTNRTYVDVLNQASFSVFKEGYKDGFGADGDHLKKETEIEYALSLGFTMVTLDCSDYIRNDVLNMSNQEVDMQVVLSDEIKQMYLNTEFVIENDKIVFEENALKRIVLTYDKAIEYAIFIYKKYFNKSNLEANFELSIDETHTPTTPMQHYYVANELVRKGVKLDTLAPRFIGEFQKGVDYVGDLKQFEKELDIHAKIARHFDYKLSIHSGSDKFSIFELVGKYTLGNFHVKTAGTNWLEAMKTISIVDPSLYKAIHKYAISMFNEAKKFYHVTTDLTKIPDVDELKDHELVDLFKNNDSRQLIHITYGYILNAKENDQFIFKDKLYQIWRSERVTYSNLLYSHIKKHLELLYLGFK